jgi:beta-lactam-binding protein with PASTA domain
MAEPPPRPPDPPEEQTVVSDSWGEEPVVVEQREEIVEEPPRRMPTIWPGLLALLVLVLAGLGALYYFSRDDDEPAATTSAVTTQATTQAEERTVPDVVGTTSSEATETLRDAGFDVNVVAVPSDRPAGTVVAQSPAAGVEQPEGTTVRLNVAEAAGTTTGETTTGATTTGATTTGQTTTQATTTSPATTTAPQQPRPATVPDVVGDELADAARSFADEGLKVAVAYVPSQEAAGRVVAQAQPPETVRKQGDTVQINVSTGAEPAAAAAVPRVTGGRLDAGREALDAAGFEVLALTVGDREVRNESTILSQSPGGGASVPRGSLVLVYV